MLYINVLFYMMATMLIASAVMVIVARNPVRSALFLVLAFVMSAGLWMLLQAEFLALVLVLVYVGAVMTLFLFVVMTLNLQGIESRVGFVKFLPLGLAFVALMVGLLIYAIAPEGIAISSMYAGLQHDLSYSNTSALGMVLYTQYAYPFELAAVLLLTAIVAGITLTFRGGQPDSKRQKIAEQLAADPAERVQLVSVATTHIDSGLADAPQQPHES